MCYLHGRVDRSPCAALHCVLIAYVDSAGDVGLDDPAEDVYGVDICDAFDGVDGCECVGVLVLDGMNDVA